MNSIVHFEIQAGDTQRAMAFYQAVFGWEFEDYSQFAGSPYWGVITKQEGQPGINGGLLPRVAPVADVHTSPRAFVCTLAVEDFDAVAARILEHGGQVALPKYALPGMAWQGYFLDSEGNTIGIHQPDENAR